jgi:hypothetical protein
MKHNRYLSRRQDERCEQSIILSDGSGAQCQRYRAHGSMFCKQHAEMRRQAINELTRLSRDGWANARPCNYEPLEKMLREGR